MRVFSKTVPVVCLLLLLVLLVHVASADTYYGSTNYNENWNGKQLTGTIDFGVYDDRSVFESDFGYVNDGAGLTAPGDGQYVYAYVINQDDISESPISYFAILGLDEDAVSSDLEYMDQSANYSEPNLSGVEPANAGFVGNDGVWKWSSAKGFIQVDEYSWLLVYSSDYDWVKGDYELRGVEDDFPVPDDGEVPEPGTIALLGLGGSLLIRRKKN